MAVQISRRFDRARIFTFNETIEDFDSMDSDVREVLLQLNVSGYAEVSESNRYAIDSIALDIYNNDELWWVLAEFNYLLNPFLLETGQRLYYPSLADLEKVIFANSDSLNDFSGIA